ncbi:hypothetical protein R69749_00124 [Paraburkholderia domus]|uniref:Extracellular solute-binding protein n=1 Tax=Paraburkholderia domus TaxID=2793075 RepID=A0A9N8QXZ2_9BURK|nr:hypothetical protein R75483_00971 [Paraburkholderia domus]CAE6746234.1 hypothetical protein R69749_00124 [Paraburkholderia domus]CAE6768742.1 hypothetical protein R70006_03848 [Paraburkholderia domus]CAE6864370.1 hypothetical protein R75471_00403 [Paraburkholderia domus]CAE6877270.1 hypothetical protein R70211_01857 [Paraburkholderia domus]
MVRRYGRTVPKDAPHLEAAMQWINYIEDPKVNAEITNEVFYPTANRAARQYVTPAMIQDATVYPSDEVLNRMTLAKPLSADIVIVRAPGLPRDQQRWC